MPLLVQVLVHYCHLVDANGIADSLVRLANFCSAAVVGIQEGLSPVGGDRVVQPWCSCRVVGTGSGTGHESGSSPM